MKRDLLRPSPPLLIVLACFAAGSAYADCSHPYAKESGMIYNGDYHTWQFCNGTNWLAFGGGLACAPASPGYNPTVPSGNGYFVLSYGTFAGSFANGQSDLPYADSLCLTDLTTHTGWIGYSTANSNGQLVAAKVHAFLCNTMNNGKCNNLMPLTTYYFANGSNSSAGGASFTTDASSNGPGDSANWSAANYFSGTYTYWTGNAGNSSTDWGLNSPGGGVDTCGFGSWAQSTNTGQTGTSAYTNGNRWDDGSLPSCTNSFHLICFVNP
jgi:hypothetical protein